MHPDNGGNPAKFAELRKASDEMVKLVRSGGGGKGGAAGPIPGVSSSSADTTGNQRGGLSGLYQRTSSNTRMGGKVDGGVYQNPAGAGGRLHGMYTRVPDEGKPGGGGGAAGIYSKSKSDSLDRGAVDARGDTPHLVNQFNDGFNPIPIGSGSGGPVGGGRPAGNGSGRNTTGIYRANPETAAARSTTPGNGNHVHDNSSNMASYAIPANVRNSKPSGVPGGFNNVAAASARLPPDHPSLRRQPPSQRHGNPDGVARDRRGPPPHGNTSKLQQRNVKTSVDVPLESIYLGGTVQVSVERTRSCDACKGSGLQSRQIEVPCNVCGGNAVPVRSQPGIASQQCPGCLDTGTTTFQPRCVECNGTGGSKSAERVSVPIPAGIPDGQEITVQGEGHDFQDGKPAGDLLVRVGQLESETCERVGQDIVIARTIPLRMAVTEGYQSYHNLPDGTRINFLSTHPVRPGTVLRCEGAGMPAYRDVPRGDLLVVCKVEFPTRLAKPPSEPRPNDIIAVEATGRQADAARKALHTRDFDSFETAAAGFEQ